MKVVLDSNIIIADFWMQSTNFKVLFESAQKGDIKIYIPEVVLDEILNKFRQRISKSKNDINSELRKFNRLSKNTIGEPIKDSDIDNSVSVYQDKIKEIIATNKITVLKYPKTDHKFLAQKAILKLKPFNANEKGYRDCLIWENIKELLTDYESVPVLPELVFVSNNYKDFATNEYELHSDLISELEDEDFDAKSVIVYPSLSEFNDKQTKLFFAQSANFEKRLKNNDIWDFNLQSVINNYLYDNFIGSELYNYDADINQDYSEPTVSSLLDEDYEIKIDSVKKLNASDYLIDVQFTVEIEIDFYIDKSDYWMLEEDNSISIQDSDWNRHVMLASSIKKIPLSMSIIINTEMNVISCQINKINENYAQQWL